MKYPLLQHHTAPHTDTRTRGQSKPRLLSLWPCHSFLANSINTKKITYLWAFSTSEGKDLQRKCKLNPRKAKELDQELSRYWAEPSLWPSGRRGPGGGGRDRPHVGGGPSRRRALREAGWGGFGKDGKVGRKWLSPIPRGKLEVGKED